MVKFFRMKKANFWVVLVSKRYILMTI